MNRKRRVLMSERQYRQFRRFLRENSGNGGDVSWFIESMKSTSSEGIFKVEIEIKINSKKFKENFPEGKTHRSVNVTIFRKYEDTNTTDFTYSIPRKGSNILLYHLIKNHTDYSDLEVEKTVEEIANDAGGQIIKILRRWQMAEDL